MTTQPFERNYTPPLYGVPEQPILRDRAGNPIPSPSTAVQAPDTSSAVGVIQILLAQVFGGALTEYAEEAWKRWNGGEPLEVILESLRNTTEYKARFSGQEGYLKLYGRRLSEAEYLSVEEATRQLTRQFDLPPGLIDNDWIGRNVIGQGQSPGEFQRRLQSWQTYERETRADRVNEEEINRQLAVLGITPTDGDWLGSLIRPDVSVDAIERRYTAGRIGAEARRAGYGTLELDEGLALADQGVTAEAARTGFGALSQAGELFGDITGETGTEALGRQEQIAAAFGTDAASRRRLERNARRRSAQFEGGGGTAQGRGGLSGLARAT